MNGNGVITMILAYWKKTELDTFTRIMKSKHRPYGWFSFGYPSLFVFCRKRFRIFVGIWSSQSKPVTFGVWELINSYIIYTGTEFEPMSYYVTLSGPLRPLNRLEWH